MQAGPGRGLFKRAWRWPNLTTRYFDISYRRCLPLNIGYLGIPCDMSPTWWFQSHNSCYFYELHVQVVIACCCHHPFSIFFTCPASASRGQIGEIPTSPRTSPFDHVEWIPIIHIILPSGNLLHRHWKMAIDI